MGFSKWERWGIIANFRTVPEDDEKSATYDNPNQNTLLADIEDNPKDSEEDVPLVQIQLANQTKLKILKVATKPEGDQV